MSETLADKLRKRRLQYEEAGVAKPIDRSKPEGIARKLGWLSKPQNKDVQKKFNEGAGNR